MDINQLRKSRILVTGGGGFLGQFLCRRLEEVGCESIVSAQNHDQLYNGYDISDKIVAAEGYDLTSIEETQRLFAEYEPDVVFHLAGYNGGIKFNLQNPADIFANNTMMAINLLNECKIARVKKVLSVVASCAYPEYEFFENNDPNQFGECTYTLSQREIMYEEDFFDGLPNNTVACHGYAKRNLQLASTYYHMQYGLNAVCVCPTTLYGPGDSFDPQRTKVVGAMVKRFVDAVDEGKQEVQCWGDGTPKREFLYVNDAACLLVESMLKYDNSYMPLNLGSGQELSIKELAETVAKVVGFKGNITWDTFSERGQLRKRLDTERMVDFLGEHEFMSLEEGIIRTAHYYRLLKRCP